MIGFAPFGTNQCWPQPTDWPINRENVNRKIRELPSRIHSTLASIHSTHQDLLDVTFFGFGQASKFEQAQSFAQVALDGDLA